jgi:hypothetical protein
VLRQCLWVVVPVLREKREVSNSTRQSAEAPSISLPGPPHASRSRGRRTQWWPPWSALGRATEWGLSVRANAPGVGCKDPRPGTRGMWLYVRDAPGVGLRHPRPGTRVVRASERELSSGSAYTYGMWFVGRVPGVGCGYTRPGTRLSGASAGVGWSCSSRVVVKGARRSQQRCIGWSCSSRSEDMGRDLGGGPCTGRCDTVGVTPVGVDKRESVLLLKKKHPHRALGCGREAVEASKRCMVLPSSGRRESDGM